MNKKLIITMIVCACSIGTALASLTVHLSCGKTVTTVDQSFFENGDEFYENLAFLDGHYCD